MKNKSVFLCLAVIFVFNTFAGLKGESSSAEINAYDVIIKNARIFDGSLKQAFQADIALKGDTIARISSSLKGKASKVIDAKNMYVSPGFIDLHTHVNGGMYYPENRAVLNYLKQGVTSVVVGQCGGSAWPLIEKAEDQIRRWTDEGIAPNAALLVGHGSVRRSVMGMEDRPPTPDELCKMKNLVKEAMDQGACGISTGLIYLPGRYAKTDEVAELVKIITPYGGIYHTHIRNEAEQLLDAIEEAIEIGKQSGAPTHISHFKVMGRANWGLVKDACVRIEQAREEGMTITADQYPYPFSNNYPYRSLIPQSVWSVEDDPERLTFEDVDMIFDHLRDEQLLTLYKKITPYFPMHDNHERFLKTLPRKRLVQFIGREFIDPSDFYGPENPRERMLFLNRMRNPEEYTEIKAKISEYINEQVGADNFIVGVCVEKQYEGKSLRQVADMMGEGIVDAAIELELMGSKCIPVRMSEEDIEYIMQKSYVGTGSDGVAPFYGIGFPHIRSYSTFIHKIKKYALEKKAVTVPHVIRSQTSLPAEIMGWKDRGRLKEGFKADIVIFDLKNLETGTSISNPHKYCEGIHYLFINGELVLEKGTWTGKLPGKVLRLKKTTAQL